MQQIESEIIDRDSIYFCMEPNCQASSRYMMEMKDMKEHQGHNYESFQELDEIVWYEANKAQNKFVAEGIIQIIKVLEDLLKEARMFRALKSIHQSTDIIPQAVNSFNNDVNQLISNEQQKEIIQKLILKDTRQIRQNVNFNETRFFTKINSIKDIFAQYFKNQPIKYVDIQFVQPFLHFEDKCTWSRNESHSFIEIKKNIATRINNKGDYSKLGFINPKFICGQTSFTARIKLNQVNV